MQRVARPVGEGRSRPNSQRSGVPASQHSFLCVSAPLRSTVLIDFCGQRVSPDSKAGRDVPVEVAKFLPTPDMIGVDAEFGRAVAIDGDTMVVGANDEDLGIKAGAAFIFQRNEGGADAWGQVAKLTASDGVIYGNFGVSVSISGDTVVIGSSGYDDADCLFSRIHIFGRNQGGADAWGLVERSIQPPGEDDSVGFASAIAISGNIILVGAHSEDAFDPDWGAAYVYDLGNLIFVDGFETGDTAGWSVTQP